MDEDPHCLPSPHFRDCLLSQKKRSWVAESLKRELNGQVTWQRRAEVNEGDAREVPRNVRRAWLRGVKQQVLDNAPAGIETVETLTVGPVPF